MISKMQQTTTDWLKQQLETYGDPGYCKIEWEILDELILQGEKIEKQNIINSFVEGTGFGEMFNNENRCYVTDAEQYLKENYCGHGLLTQSANTYYFHPYSYSI